MCGRSFGARSARVDRLKEFDRLDGGRLVSRRIRRARGHTVWYTTCPVTLGRSSRNTNESDNPTAAHAATRKLVRKVKVEQRSAILRTGRQDKSH